MYILKENTSQQLCKIIGQLVKHILLFLKIICISNTTPEQFQCITPFLIPYECYFQILLKIEAQIPVSVCFFSKATHRDTFKDTQYSPFLDIKIFKNSSSDTSRSFRVILQKKVQLLKRKVFVIVLVACGARMNLQPSSSLSMKRRI